MVQDVIRVTPSHGPGGIEWKLCHGNNCGAAGSYPTIEFPAKSGPHVIVISIDDPQHTGITFASPPSNPTSASDALWVVDGPNKHPAKGGGNPGNQLQDATLANATTLVVTNKNDNANPMWMSYRLNFVGSNGVAVSPIDPDWKNGGTGSGISIDYTTALIGAAVGAFVAFLFIRFALGWKSLKA